MVTLLKQDYKKNKKLYFDIELQLRKRLTEDIPITHVGSTAIPNMYGKNIIDVLIGAKDETQFKEITDILEEKSFVASQKNKDDIYQFFSSTADETGAGDVHIHLVVLNTERYSEFILLKDYLLQNKDEALNYSNFKQKIINEGIIDRKEYKKVKSEYVTNLLERAKAWRCKKMKKNKVFKLIFCVSFVPYIILFLISLYYAINGYDVYTWILPTYVKTIYGMEAFWETLFLNCLSLFYIPLLPLCLVIQVLYVISNIIKRR